ncbi:MAG TPA: SLBB domain-containing protein [Saprospiraceae bacterium]|nr:SLBB domain-containing protein [Saprospiraceae bacterium]
MSLKLIFKGVCLLVMLLVCPWDLGSQVTSPPITEEDARTRLAEKGITEEELRDRLTKKGWDVDNLDPKRLGEFQQVLIQTVEELEREKSPQTAKPPSAVPAAKQEPVLVRDTVRIPEDTIIEKRVPQVIYGHHLFKDRDLKVFRQADDIKPSDSYILGSGDVLLIQIYGPAQLQSTYTIDNLGYIEVKSGLPRIALKGLTLGEAKRLLRERLHRFYTYNDDQFSVAIQTTRNITVNFFGEVETTGGITLPAVNTLFNALAAAGGPSEIGSVRNIKLISGVSERIFDLYKFMNDPRIAESFYLQDNDYVHIPVAERIVSIRGSIRRPYKYELADGENLLKLIEFAGGANADAYLKDVQITRYTGDERIVASVNLRDLSAAKGDYILYHGDEIVVSSLEEEVTQYVEIKGAVIKTGKFEYTEGMRVADLLDRSTLLNEARRDFGYILRYNQNGTYSYIRFVPGEALRNRGSGENILLLSRDIVEIPSQKSYADKTFIAIDGSVRNPGRFRFEPGEEMKLQDVLLVAGGLLPSAAEFGYIVRRKPEDPKKTEYLPFNAVQVALDASSPDNLPLQQMDSIYVFDKRSLEDDFTVRVSGAVRNPGLFAYSPGLTIERVLRLAGGFTFSAATNRVDISRTIIIENEPTRTTTYTAQVARDLNTIDAGSTFVLMPFDHIIVREVPEFELERTVYVAGEVKFPGVYSIINNNERISSFISRAGGLTEEAFPDGASLYRAKDSIGVVVINLQESLTKPSSQSDIILRQNDTLYIPKRQELVTISGAVNFRDVLNEEFIESGNKINVGYVQNKNAMYYVDKYAAGISESGRRRLISVRHANGRLEKTKTFGFVYAYPKVTPGATINVGSIAAKTEKALVEKEPVDWGNVIRDTIAQATAVLTLILLLERVN